jgi:pimeloyl-ACP methyl ester carboxylesterase
MAIQQSTKTFLLTGLLLVLGFKAYSKEFSVEDVEFVSHSATLSGSIVLPSADNMYAAIVFVHGSGKQQRNMHLAKQFAQAGIAALVYDKRGAGKSGGQYESQQSVSEKNINLLADDALAAIQILQQHKLLKHLPIGLTGISQAGWIVPIAAEKNQNKPIDFMLLWSGPVCKVSEEDIFSKYTADLDSQQNPSFTDALHARKSKYIWPSFLGKDSNPSDSLVKLNIPGLWIFGENDGSVPVDLSIQRLKTLAKRGKHYDYVLFSNLGHNNMPQTFATATHWIKTLAAK